MQHIVIPLSSSLILRSVFRRLELLFPFLPRIGRQRVTTILHLYKLSKLNRECQLQLQKVLHVFKSFLATHDPLFLYLKKEKCTKIINLLKQKSQCISRIGSISLQVHSNKKLSITLLHVLMSAQLEELDVLICHRQAKCFFMTFFRSLTPCKYLSKRFSCMFSLKSVIEISA